MDSRDPPERDNNSRWRRGAPRREESLRRVREAQRTLSRMHVARSELTGRPLSLRAIACLFYYRCVFHKTAAVTHAEGRLHQLRTSGSSHAVALRMAEEDLVHARSGLGPYGSGLLLRGPNPRPTDTQFLKEWREGQAIARGELKERVSRHLQRARAGHAVSGLRWMRVGERWRGFAPDRTEWAPLDRPGQFWRRHEHEFRFSGTGAYGEPALPGRYGTLHALPVGLPGEPTLETARRVDSDPAYPLGLVRMSVPELESLLKWTNDTEPPQETVAQFLVRGTGDRWEADEKRLRRLLKDASRIEFRHLGDLGSLSGRALPPEHVLDELLRRPV
jgi:hypothetical protein